MQIKDFRAQVKAVGDDQSGQFTALVSVFGNEDSSGDVVLPGAFTQTLADWKTSGLPIPVIWSHDWTDPFSNVGHVLDAQETAKGLQVDGQLDINSDVPEAAARARQVYNLLKSGRVSQFSFAYDVIEGGWEVADGEEVFALKTLQLFEVGPCLVGANQETELLAIKAAALVSGQKEGRVLSGQLLEKVKSAHGHLADVIAAAEKANGDDAKSSPPAGGKDAPSGASDQQDTSRPEDDPEAAAKAAAAGSDGAAPVDRLSAEIALRLRKEWD